ncbi:MAG: FHA domain-containing protein [Leptolyngbyaceae cyanobacterium SM2_5_2]|nr:FHA domain-containing protein [Leptolyngbyaceae cyanobacterium SM2_5_2]
MITLSLLHPLHKTPVQSWSFDQEPLICIGRSSDNDVILYSAVVSRHHVEIRRHDEGWIIKSLGTNGTYLNGKRITEIAVEDGIIIRLARSGPNLQIHMTEEKRDPLKELLLSRRKAEASNLAESSPQPTLEELTPDALPNQTTIINH